MPFSIFFTQKGHAIHGSNETKRLGTPASHGCVRLLPANAESYFCSEDLVVLSERLVSRLAGQPF